MARLIAAVLCLAVVLCGAGMAAAEEERRFEANRSGDLLLVIGAGATPDYIETWKSPEAPGRIERLKETTAGSPVHFGFFVTGYALDQSGEMNCALDVEFFAPDGGKIISKPGYAFASGRTTPTGFVLMDAVMGLALEPAGPEGVYRLEGVLTDNVTGKKTTSVYEIRLVKPKRE